MRQNILFYLWTTIDSRYTKLWTFANVGCIDRTTTKEPYFQNRNATNFFFYKKNSNKSINILKLCHWTYLIDCTYTSISIMSILQLYEIEMLWSMCLLNSHYIQKWNGLGVCMSYYLNVFEQGYEMDGFVCGASIKPDTYIDSMWVLEYIFFSSKQLY